MTLIHIEEQFCKFVPCLDGDDTEKERLEKQEERKRKKAISSNIIRELKQQYSEAPEEITVLLFSAIVTLTCSLKFNLGNISRVLKFL